ncbi:MAG: hypothetical protein MMC33_002015 [Icmadophila ericetorum]|nr:hypothetical protein [Icmadophila ericetorum]
MISDTREQGPQEPPPAYSPEAYSSQGYHALPNPNVGWPPQQTAPQEYARQNNAAYHMNQGFPGYPTPQQGYEALDPNPHGASTLDTYGAPQQPWGIPPSISAPPSPGYGPNITPSTEPTAAVEALHNAVKGTNEILLISNLAHYLAIDMVNLKLAYRRRYSRDLEADIEHKTKHHFKESLVAILRGPLQEDVYLLRKALEGLGTNERLLNDVVLSRSNADLNAIKAAYFATYQRSAEVDVANDHKGPLEETMRRFYSMVLAATRAEESAPVIPQAIEGDVTTIHTATVGNDQITVCSILTSRSDAQIRAIAFTYEQRYRITLEEVINKGSKLFSGHLKTALTLIVRGALDRAMRDAVLLEECMAGLGTKDDLLVSRLVQLHWNQDHMGQVRGAYKVRYKKDLVTRIHGETSGNYRNLLKAMVE